MKSGVRAISLALPVLLALPSQAFAAKLPEILVSASNPVPACVTPGRLNAMVKSLNPSVDRRFEEVARAYRKHGRALGVRWDFAYFQMLVETNSLFKEGKARRGGVSPDQNNFAGLGAVGDDDEGESFDDIQTGALAHLQHILLYAGVTSKAPVAERTRKVQEWKIVHPWAQRLRRPVTYRDLLGKWAPKDRPYHRGIEQMAKMFFDDFCKIADPDGGLDGETMQVSKVRPQAPAKPKTLEELTGPSPDVPTRSSLGAAKLAKAVTPPTPPPAVTPPVAPAVVKPAAPEAPAAKRPARKPAAPLVTASAGGVARLPVPKPVPAMQPCRIWTASYGGKRATLIKSVTGAVVNYTVLDVNEGAEERETKAFIEAYARGGALLARYKEQAKAMQKAFELCPEG
ncbi:MAG: hypothetical protein AB7U66_11600 [Hyphomicrobiaceae bacterium]